MQSLDMLAGIRSPEFLSQIQMNEIKTEVNCFSKSLDTHPLAKIMKKGFISRELLKEYALLQYVDIVLRVPMLAIVKDRVTNSRLIKIIAENLITEASTHQISQITMYRQFLESLGINPHFGDFNFFSPLNSTSVYMMNSISGLTESEIYGWMIVMEISVSKIFQLAMPAFERIKGVDLRYLNEHVLTKSREKAHRMYGITNDLLLEGFDLEEIKQGIVLGGRSTLCIPDSLYAKYISGVYHRSIPKMIK